MTPDWLGSCLTETLRIRFPTDSKHRLRKIPTHARKSPLKCPLLDIDHIPLLSRFPASQYLLPSQRPNDPQPVVSGFLGSNQFWPYSDCQNSGSCDSYNEAINHPKKMCVCSTGSYKVKDFSKMGGNPVECHKCTSLQEFGLPKKTSVPRQGAEYIGLPWSIATNLGSWWGWNQVIQRSSLI